MNEATQPFDLSGACVLVTRPAQQASAFLEALHQYGAQGLLFPCLEIEAIKLGEAAQQQLKSINQFDMLLFISRNAVQQFQLSMQALGQSMARIEAAVGAIGQATAQALESYSLPVSILAQQGYDTEALLSLPEMQAARLKGQKILLLKGEGGRKTLQHSLVERGVELQSLDLYRRIKPAQDSGIKRQQLNQNWHTLGINCICVTSNESLQNLYDMLDPTGRQHALQTRLIVPSQRGYNKAKEMGFKAVSVAESAHDQDMLKAIAL